MHIFPRYWPGAGVSPKGGRPGLDRHSQKLLARGRYLPERGGPGKKKVGLNGRTGAGISPKGGGPVRDQGGIKAGPRRDHILFNLFVTDYHQLSTVFVFLYFFELQAFALYQASEILSKRLGEISYARISARADASTAAPPFEMIVVETLPACCLSFYIR